MKTDMILCGTPYLPRYVLHVFVERSGDHVTIHFGGRDSKRRDQRLISEISHSFSPLFLHLLIALPGTI